MTGHGAHAPLMKVPAFTLVPMPDAITFEEGAAISGTLLPGLPPSMMQVLGGSEGGEPVVRTATTVVWDGSKAVDYSVRGARFLALQIER